MTHASFLVNIFLYQFKNGYVPTFITKSFVYTYAKLLYYQNKFPEAARIFTSCIGITDKVYEFDTLTKDYLLQNLAAVHATMRNIKVALMYYAQAENIFHKFLDEEHPNLLICREQQENVISIDGQKVDLLEDKNV